MKRILGSFGAVLVFCLQVMANPVPSGSALSIIAPTTITIPGNYRLANDIAGTVIIAADNVSFDLENRTISGGTNGIEITSQSEVTIKNGTIENATSNGIAITQCSNINLVNLDLNSNTLDGIGVVTSTCVVIQDSTFSTQGRHGIFFDHTNGSIIAHNKVFSNLFDGIRITNPGSLNNVITNNLVNNNTDVGIRIENTSGNTVSENNVNNNMDNNIQCSGANNNVIYRNVCMDAIGVTAAGIELRTSSTNIVSENTCDNNAGFNIRITAGSDDNIVTKNNCSESRDGIAISVVCNGNLVTDNIANYNVAGGISIGAGCTLNSIKNNKVSGSTIGFSDVGTNNSFFNNCSSVNGTNYSGVPTSVISIFDISVADFVFSHTICCWDNLSVIS